MPKVSPSQNCLTVKSQPLHFLLNKNVKDVINVMGGVNKMNVG